MILDEAQTLPTTPLPPENYLNRFQQPKLNKTEFLMIGYGTEVRKSDSGPQKPTPMRQPIVRRFTTEIGQKLKVRSCRPTATSTIREPEAERASATRAAR